MKSIQKYFTLIFLALFNLTSISLFAQLPGAGVRAGLCFSNVKVYDHDADYKLRTRTKTGLLVGIYFNAVDRDYFILRPEVDLVLKGYQEQSKLYPSVLGYLDFSLELLYKIKGTRNHFLIGMAPVAGMNTNESYNSTFPRIDLGLGAMASYEFAIGFSLQLNYTYGLTKFSIRDSDETKLSNRYYGITVGYTF